jgi:hypothetical protein
LFKLTILPLNLKNCSFFKQAIENGEGELLVSRRPSTKYRCTYSREDFLPREFFVGFYLKDTLWLHISTCFLKPNEKASSGNYCRNAKVLLSPFLKPLTEEESNLETFFNGMKETNENPDIPSFGRKDPLIGEFAKSTLQRDWARRMSRESRT